MMNSQAKSAKYNPSAAQKKGLKLIKDLLGLSCKDMSFEGVSAFLDKHLEEAVKKLKDRPPSPKQSAMIQQIEKALEVKFEGSTMTEASTFLNEYLPKFKATWYKKGKR